MEETMFDAGRRPSGRLFYWLAVVMTVGSGLTAFGAAPVPQSGPATTTIADTVYLADGSRAQGSLIITWPAFLTVSGAAVAGGTTTTTLGTNGALSVALVPNAGATPAGMYYTVVYQLGPAEVRTEYWMVPATSPANLAAVRTAPGSGVAAQPVSVQYVNSALATKANDSAVVHLSGTETISGTKTFAAAPSVPAPTSTGQVANKAYVDQSIPMWGEETSYRLRGER
jgi:trimeric autotransporter adhesin